MNQIPDILSDAEVVVAVADNAKTDENDNKEVEGSTIAAEHKLIHTVEKSVQYFEQQCVTVMDLLILQCLLDKASK